MKKILIFLFFLPITLFGQTEPNWEQIKNRPVVSVAKYGARGDGTTNSTAAIASAIAALPPDGGTIFFPAAAGSYITDTIQFPTAVLPTPLHRIVFSGAGPTVSILEPLYTNKPIFKGQAASTPGYSTAGNTIEHLGFRAHASGSTGSAIFMGGMSFTKIDDIEFFCHNPSPVAGDVGVFDVGICLQYSNIATRTIEGISGPMACFSNKLSRVAVRRSSGPRCIVQARGDNDFVGAGSYAQLLGQGPNVIQISDFKINTLIVATATVFDISTPTQCVFIDKCHIEGLQGVVLLPGYKTVMRDCYIEAGDMTAAGPLFTGTSNAFAAQGLNREDVGAIFQHCFFASSDMTNRLVTPQNATRYSFWDCWDNVFSGYQGYYIASHAITLSASGSGTADIYLNTASGSSAVIHFNQAGNRQWNLMSQGARFFLTSGAGNHITIGGSGSPQGQVTAPIGSIYTREDGGASTTFWVKEAGTATNTGWMAK